VPYSAHDEYGGSPGLKDRESKVGRDMLLERMQNELRQRFWKNTRRDILELSCTRGLWYQRCIRVAVICSITRNSDELEMSSSCTGGG